MPWYVWINFISSSIEKDNIAKSHIDFQMLAIFFQAKYRYFITKVLNFRVIVDKFCERFLNYVSSCSILKNI